MGFINFIFSKLFLINLAIVGVLVVPACVGLFYFLDTYTEHDITVETPDFIGMTIGEIEAFADTNHLEFEIIDSLYSDELPKGTVAAQEPVPGYKVKRGRMIYVTINALLPKQVSIPDVRNLSLRQAKAVLESVGLKLGDLEYRPDIAKNAVLGQKIKGKEAKKGEMTFSGTVVDLVLGDGLSNTRVPIPYLLYYNLKEATDRLNLSSLNLATFKIDTVTMTDTALVRVYKQIPAFNEKNLVPMGTSVILYLTEDTLSIKYDSTLYFNPLALPDSLVTQEDLNEQDFEGGN